jgi:hypothetical protein
MDLPINRKKHKIPNSVNGIDIAVVISIEETNPPKFKAIKPNVMKQKSNRNLK